MSVEYNWCRSVKVQQQLWLREGGTPAEDPGDVFVKVESDPEVRGAHLLLQYGTVPCPSKVMPYLYWAATVTSLAHYVRQGQQLPAP